MVRAYSCKNAFLRWKSVTPTAIVYIHHQEVFLITLHCCMSAGGRWRDFTINTQNTFEMKASGHEIFSKAKGRTTRNAWCMILRASCGMSTGMDLILFNNKSVGSLLLSCFCISICWPASNIHIRRAHGRMVRPFKCTYCWNVRPWPLYPKRDWKKKPPCSNHWGCWRSPAFVRSQLLLVNLTACWMWLTQGNYYSQFSCTKISCSC